MIHCAMLNSAITACRVNLGAQLFSPAMQTMHLNEWVLGVPHKGCKLHTVQYYKHCRVLQTTLQYYIIMNIDMKYGILLHNTAITVESYCNGQKY